MNMTLSNTIATTSPAWNKKVTEGASKEILSDAPAFLDKIFKDSIKSLNPKVNLKYLGYRRLTPKEEFDKLFSNTDNRVNYDLARSDLYMVEHVFSLDGNEIRRQQWLPFTDSGNLIHISNTVYHIVPVLSDTVISPSAREVFTRLLKDKLSFKSVNRNILVNGEKVPGEIIYSYIVKVNESQIKDNIGKPLPPISLYLLGEYGFYTTLKRYVKNTDVFITMTTDAKEIEDIKNKGYIIYESTKIKPRGLKDIGYLGHDVKICVSEKIGKNMFLENFINGIIYALDLFPDQADDFMRLIKPHNNNENDLYMEKLFWRILLGRISFKNSYSVDRIITDINETYDTLQGYMDSLTKEKLHENGLTNVENFFDLLAVILTNYNVWLLSYKEYNSDINNRYIDIRYYIFYDIIIGFNKVILNISKRGSKKSLNLKEVNKIFSNELSPRKIFGLVKSKAQNIAIMLAESTSDVKYLKITALLEDRWSFITVKCYMAFL